VSKLASAPVGLDAIRFEVIRNGLTAIADEMALTVQRAAYSTNIKTRLDFSCAVFDSQARLLAQSFGQPNHLGSLTHFVPAILETYGRERLRPGDGVLCNDGLHGGVHLNDVCLVVPAYFDEQLVGFVAAIAHHVDVGGGTPGSIGMSREIFQDGLIISPIRLLVDGRVDESVLRLITTNVRSPLESAGDFRAQVAGTSIGVRGVQRMIAKHGLRLFTLAIEELLDYTERRARAELSRLPKGTFEAEGFMDSDGFSDEPIKVKVKVSVKADRVVFDLTGSDAQRPGPLNATYAMVLSNCAYALRVLMDPDLPTNAGFYRVLELVAPKGTVVNAISPAAIASGWETAFRVCETAMEALATAVPERLTAGSKGTLCNLAFGGIDPRTGRYFVFFESLAGGYGARARKDGIDAVQPHVQNTENSPVEETEANYPVTILKYQLIADSEGAGRQRGGLGLRRDYTFDGEVTFSVFADKSKFAPKGLSGGGSAEPSRYVRNPDTDSAVDYPSKLSVRLQPGEVFSVRMGGGGGFGPPSERSTSLVLSDVLGGKVSVDRARNVYAVVVDGSTRAIDDAATSRLRAGLRPATKQ